MEDINFEALKVQLFEKDKTLSIVQKAFDDYMDSSKELEMELEASLEQEHTKFNDLMAKKIILEEKLNELQEKNLKYAKENTRLEAEVVRFTENLESSEEKRRILEIKVDELTNNVRILETTEEDLNHKLLRAEEDIIFLQTDLHELSKNNGSPSVDIRRKSIIDSEKDQIINRMNLEILELKYLVDSKDKKDLLSFSPYSSNDNDDSSTNHLNDQLQTLMDLSNQIDMKDSIIENLKKKWEILF